MIIGILIMLALALAFVIFFNYSKKKLLTEQMNNQKLALQHQEKLLHSTILTQEKERKRIARELHDEIGSKLNVIFLNIHRLKKINTGNEEVKLITDEVDSLIHNTLHTTRRISHDLLPPTLEDFGLIEAIKELRDAFQHVDNFKIVFKISENEGNVLITSRTDKNKMIELNIFRVLQELINNSIKHGNATEVVINLSLGLFDLKLEYADNGKGFDEKIYKNKKGLGMKNVESRLNMIHANYQFDSTPEKGVKMMIALNTNQK